MLFLIVMSVLAVGFYASTTMSVQVAKSDRDAADALRAAETGLEFMRHQLWSVSVPADTAGGQVFNEVYADLQSQLDNTPNFQKNKIGRNGNRILVPASAGAYVAAGNLGLEFRATVTHNGGNDFVLDVVGRRRGSAISRALRIKCPQEDRTTPIFAYGVSSKGGIRLQSGTVDGVPNPQVANLMSALKATPAVNVASGGTIDGDLFIVDGAGVQVSGSVGGTSVQSTILKDHVHTVDAPDFPIPDPTAVKSLATNTYNKFSNSPFVNMRIPAGTNPKFTGNAVIQGILYVESPNTIEFGGNAQIQGFIVFESGSSTTDQILFKGGVTQAGVPAGSTFDDVRNVTGISILSPGAHIGVSGGFAANVTGSIITNTFAYSGSSTLRLNNGTIVGLSTAANAVDLNGKGVEFSGTGATSPPSAAFKYNRRLATQRASYLEVTP